MYIYPVAAAIAIDLVVKHGVSRHASIPQAENDCTFSDLHTVQRYAFV